MGWFGEFFDVEKFIFRLRERLGALSVSSNAVSQLALKFQYMEMMRKGLVLPSLADVGFKVFSQTDEDGILLYLFSIIGATNKKCVEICAGNGIECNTANLIINHGWLGLLFDGNEKNVRRGKYFFKKNRATYVYPPVFKCRWITRENVNQEIRESGFDGEIDLLSLDIDGVDYWIWEAITVINPRVVVAEYQSIIGPDRAITVPYSEDFAAQQFMVSGASDYYGASLLAFKKLADKKGYRLVGCNRYGFNAFFIKKGICEETIPEIQVKDCFKHPKAVSASKQLWPDIKDLPWVEV